MSDTDTETQRMSTGEIALVREIVRWRRNHGSTSTGTPPRRGWRAGPGGSVSLTEDGDIGITADYHGGPYEWYRARSLTEGVDLLVALGYLPARFSSAYEAGWRTAEKWLMPDADEADEFRRLFHDPENVSFPVGYLA
jgi:hypothetical protein